MKILQVTNLFSPVHGGAAEVPYQLSKELAKRGHDVAVYTSDAKMGQERFTPVTGVKISPFKTLFGLATFYVTPAIIGQAKVEIKQTNVIHLHNYRTFQNVVVHHYARKYGIPYVLQAHGSLPRIMGKKILKQLYDNAWGYRLLHDAARVFAVTDFEAAQYKSMGVSADRVEIVPHGVDLAEFNSLPKKGDFKRKYGLKEDQRIILYLGRIHQIKGLDLLVEAFADIARVQDNVNLVITGPDDGYLSTLKRLVSNLNIGERVLFTGLLDRQEKLKAYIDADVYVLPSSYEIFGITILEACACGTPVVITDRCGIADVINGQAGIAVPYDKEQLASAITHLLNDDKARLEFGKRGKLLVRDRFNWERIAKQVEGIYMTVLNSSTLPLRE